LLPNCLKVIARQIRLGSFDCRLRLLHQSLLYELLLFDIFNRSFGRLNVRLSLGELGPIVVVDDFDKQVASLHPLEIPDWNAADVSWALGGKWRDIGLEISIIGSLQDRCTDPEIPIDGHDGEKEDGQHNDESTDTRSRPS